MTDPRDHDPGREPADVLPFDETRADAGDAEVARRLADAGARPELPEEDLAALTSAAHAAWRRGVAERHEAAAPRSAGPGRQLATLALAASLVAVLGLGAFYATMLWIRDSIGAARVASVDGEAWVEDREDGTVRRQPLVPGAVVGWGHRVVVADEATASVALDLQRGVDLRLAPGSRVAILSGYGSDAPFEAFFRSLAIDLGRADPAPFEVALERGALLADTGRDDVPAGTPPLVAVRTALGTVRDVGTRFSVHLLDDPGAPGLGVRVADGEVSVQAATGTWRAGAGEELRLGAGGALRRRPWEAPERPGATAWQGGWDGPADAQRVAAPAFRLDGATVDAFLAWVAAETGWEVVYADAATTAAAGDVVLHGDLGGLSAERAPFALLPGAGMEATLRDGRLVVARTDG